MDSLTAENREKMVSPYAYGHGRLRTCGLHLGRSWWTILYGGDIFRQFMESLHCIAFWDMVIRAPKSAAILFVSDLSPIHGPLR